MKLKTVLSSVLFGGALIILIGAALTFSTPETARAQATAQVCGLATLHGSYVFDAHGFNIVNGVAVPKAIVEGIDFYGDGTLVSPFATVSINGTIIRSSGGGGTYTVAEDCTGTLSFTGSASYDFYVRRNGRELWMIQTGPAEVPAVFEGMARQVPRCNPGE